MSSFSFFIYSRQDPEIRPLVEKDSKSLEQMLPEIPLWVKNPDYDRVSYTLLLSAKISIEVSMIVHLGARSSLVLITLSLSRQIDWLNKFIEYMWPYLDKVCL